MRCKTDVVSMRISRPNLKKISKIGFEKKPFIYNNENALRGLSGFVCPSHLAVWHYTIKL